MENFTRNFSQSSLVQTEPYDFEQSFTMVGGTSWMKRYWWLSLVLVFVYVILIHVGREYMKNRPRYSLRGPLFMWNALLTTLYVAGLVRSFPALATIFYHKGFYNFVCDECPFDCHNVSLFWGSIFVWMKAPELLDTAFVILRKQPLFFLHWYHHCTVLVFTWYLYGNVSTPGTFYGLVNAVVHALMYFYYTLKSLSIRVPRPISMALTFIQISQMAIGCYTNYYVFRIKNQGVTCPASFTDIWAAFVIYVSYLFLFVWYFYQAYIAKDALIIAKMKGKKIE